MEWRMRKVISLDGAWRFRHETDRADREVSVPGPWQAQCPDLRLTAGRATYRRRFERPAGEMPGCEAYLRFGAVSYLAEVLVNGVSLTTHEGGYLPFECRIPPDLLQDMNEVEVRCLLPDAGPNDAGIPLAEIPHGKQSWYGPLGGIWQSVTIEMRHPVHLIRSAIVSDRSGRVNVTLTLSAAAQGAAVTLTVSGPQGGATVTEAVAGTTHPATLTVQNPALWSPDAPSLYRLEVTLSYGVVLDTTLHSFGFRSIETREGRLLLNGQPLYLRAALDQAYYPEGICTPPSLAFLEDQVVKAKAMGLNMLRCHIKVPDPRYLEVADRLGMLIWAEVPSVGVFTENSARRMKDTIEGMLARDGHHPCIVIWNLINEDWGLKSRDSAENRAWLMATFDWLKALDRTRLVVDNSPCHDNFHVKSDLDDYHYYRTVPERREEWDRLTAEFARGAAWTWSPHGDGTRRGDEPKIVSEFGVWGLPQPAGLAIDGEQPWWLRTGQNFGEGVAYPNGMAERFADLGLNRVFGSLEAFVTATQWYQFANLKYQTESIRGWPQIQGYVVTELTDVHWEANGLLDMNRNPRVFNDRLSQVNADVVILPRVARYAGRAGEVWGFDVAVASGGVTLRPGVLHWRTDGAEGVLPFAGAAAVSVAELGRVQFTLPQAAAHRMLTVEMELRIAGRLVQRNQVDLAVYAPRQTTGLPSIAARDPDLAARARALGYSVVPAAEAEVILCTALTPPDIATLQSGARYLLLATAMAPQGDLPAKPGPRLQPLLPLAGDDLPDLTIADRHDTIWRGDWIASFSWIRREGAFAGLPGGPLLDLSYSDVVPHHVMGGWDAMEFSGPVVSGLVVGWVHKPAALIGRWPVGAGALTATTFRLTGAPAGTDPVADALFDALIAHAAGEGLEAAG
jgi:hypothetical protein